MDKNAFDEGYHLSVLVELAHYAAIAFDSLQTFDTLRQRVRKLARAPRTANPKGNSR
jgi:hypothetical protein